MAESLTHADSIFIAASPAEVYAAVSDVTRTGELSPVCAECWWDEGEGPTVGAHFTGRNVKPDRTWETRSQVTVAEPGHAFGWTVGEGFVNWSYSMVAVDGGTELTESWEFTPAGLERFAQRYGEQAQHEINNRKADALSGIPATLAAIKQVIEHGTAQR